MAALLIFLFGLAVGSFLHSCIYRLPAGLPLAGAFIGRVPDAFSARHILVVLLTGGLFVWCYSVIGLSPELAKALILTCFLVVITFIDYDHQLILDQVLVWLAGTGVATNLVLAYGPLEISTLAPPPGPLAMLLGGLLGGGLMLAIALISRGGMGGGDIKFAAALGLWLGWQLTLLNLLLAFFLGGVGGVAVLVLRLKGRKDMIPFGPFIAAGAYLVHLYGREAIIWYLQHYLR
jgi:leader peptidase (prepilin peptidase)/N-methyltransferase